MKKKKSLFKAVEVRLSLLNQASRAAADSPPPAPWPYFLSYL